jgi:hypothetical protein
MIGDWLAGNAPFENELPPISAAGGSSLLREIAFGKNGAQSSGSRRGFSATAIALCIFATPCKNAVVRNGIGSGFFANRGEKGGAGAVYRGKWGLRRRAGIAVAREGKAFWRTPGAC